MEPSNKAKIIWAIVVIIALFTAIYLSVPLGKDHESSFYYRGVGPPPGGRLPALILDDAWSHPVSESFCLNLIDMLYDLPEPGTRVRLTYRRSWLHGCKWHVMEVRSCDLILQDGTGSVQWFVCEGDVWDEE